MEGGVYVAEVDTEIKFLIDSDDFIAMRVEAIYKNMPFNSERKNRIAAKRQLEFMMKNTFGSFSIGDTMKNNLSLKFLNTEKGWKLKETTKR